MKNVSLTVLFFISLLPLCASAYVDCSDTTDGCTVSQLVEISQQTHLTAQDRAAALLQAVAILQKQLTALTTTQPHASSCLDLSYPLVIGSTDAESNGEVSKLQKFLLENNYGDPDGDSGYLLQHVTGYYGVKTAASVVNWQKAHGMNFVTTKSGVGPMTRSKMSCRQTVAQCPTYESAPVISSISPASATVGSTIEIKGCNFLGFESDKTVVFTNSSGVKGIFNARADAATRESNTVLRMTIPENICTQQNWYSGLPCTSYLKMEPGQYTIYTNSYGGNSNSVYFTVTQ